jgi:hypothetical protein
MREILIWIMVVSDAFASDATARTRAGGGRTCRSAIVVSAIAVDRVDLAPALARSKGIAHQGAQDISYDIS